MLPAVTRFCVELMAQQKVCLGVLHSHVWGYPATLGGRLPRMERSFHMSHSQNSGWQSHIWDGHRIHNSNDIKVFKKYRYRILFRPQALTVAHLPRLPNTFPHWDFSGLPCIWPQPLENAGFEPENHEGKSKVFQTQAPRIHVDMCIYPTWKEAHQLQLLQSMSTRGECGSNVGGCALDACGLFWRLVLWVGPVCENPSEVGRTPMLTFGRIASGCYARAFKALIGDR